MSFFNIFRRSSASAGGARVRAQANEGQWFEGLTDPALAAYVQARGLGPSDALRNMAALRCVSLISESIGMLPLNLRHATPAREMATELAAYRLLKLKPNDWQTPYEFKSQMQLNVLQYGNAYARVIWSRGRPIALIPLPPASVQAQLTSAWHMRYDYTAPTGGVLQLGARDILHLRDLSVDGVVGLSRMALAKGAIDLARAAETAASNLFETGVMAGGAIENDKPLSDVAYARMQQSLSENYTGSRNAHKWMLLEDGAKAKQFTATAENAQHIENRNAQIEEVARAFGVPRPLLMMDDTSWGSGIQQLGIFFIQYGLQHWFTAWEQAVARTLLTEDQLGKVVAKFNEHALLRGTLAEQADYFAKALGAGGTAPWISQNEVRDALDMPASDDPQTDRLRNPMTQKGPTDEPAETP